MVMSNGPVRFKVGLQRIMDRSTMEAGLVAVSLAMRDAVYCANMMEELGFGNMFR